MTKANYKQPEKRTELAHRLHDVPHRPGVYIMKDAFNRVIYVGKAKDLRKRLSGYFVPSRFHRADLKTRLLIESICDFEIHTVRSEPEALLLEGRLIKDFRPKFNISFRDDKRFLLVKVNLAEPFPRFIATRQRLDDGARYFGPFPHSGALRGTLRLMNKLFGLRSCRPTLPGEADHRHCMEEVIKKCSAPCIGKITREAYFSRVMEACAFLEGRSKELVKTLETEMKQAAEKQDFERAAQLRDMIADLQRTTRPARRFTRHSLPATIDPTADLITLGEVLGLPGPPQLMECFDISNISTTHIVASMVCFRDGRPDRYNYRRYRIKSVHGQDDFASMAEVIRRRYSRVLSETNEPDEDSLANTQISAEEAAERVLRTRPPRRGRLPNLIIVDGGRGQLTSAKRELDALGLSFLPVIGLAKENEEIYRPDYQEPLRIPNESGALKMLQRIRDEAHRVANGYHQLLMKRRIAESLLDGCPGINTTRKAALLAAFGSVTRLRKASAEKIAEVESIGPKLAITLRQWLDTH